MSLVRTDRLLRLPQVLTWLSGNTSIIKSVQRGVITLNTTNPLTNTATITAVDPANAVLHFLGNSYNAAAMQAQFFDIRLTFTNATTITAQRGNSSTNTSDVSFEVIEYWPGTIKSIQRGTVVGSVGTATITAVDPLKTNCMWLGQTATGDDGRYKCGVKLNDATTVGVVFNVGYGGVATAGYQVVEYN